MSDFLLYPSLMKKETLPLSVTIITKNEEKMIEAAIQSVSWAKEILVVDSGSTDRTVDLAKKAGARVILHSWQGYGQQKNFAQAQATQEWVLNIDADERVSPELALEIQEKINPSRLENADLCGLYIPRLTWYLDRWIYHGGWYPNYLLRLVKKKHARWTEPLVHEALQVSGKTAYCQFPLRHFSFEKIEDQVLTNLTFARLGSEMLRQQRSQPAWFKLILKPIGKFLETYVWKKGYLDGMAGFIISVNAAHSSFLKYAYLFESTHSGPSQTS